MRKNFLMLAALVFMVSCLNLGAAFAAHPQGTSRLSGFTPGDQVTFKILSSDGLISQGAKSIQSDGTLFFSYPISAQKKQGYLAYDFQIETAEGPVNVLVRVNTKTGEMTATGSGMSEFSSLSMSTPSQNIDSKTDWAGLFHEKTHLSRKNAAQPSFKIALYGASGLPFPASSKSPGIIEVQVFSAPGGGGPLASGVNNFSSAVSSATSDFGSLSDALSGFDTDALSALDDTFESLDITDIEELEETLSSFEGLDTIEDALSTLEDLDTISDALSELGSLDALDDLETISDALSELENFSSLDDLLSEIGDIDALDEALENLLELSNALSELDAVDEALSEALEAISSVESAVEALQDVQALSDIMEALDIDDIADVESLLSALGISGLDSLASLFGLSSFSSSSSDLSTSDSSAMQAAIKSIVENYVTAFMLMTEQFSAVMMQQMLTVGQFFDAKQQLETQRLHQQLTAQAHKDYHPSEGMCRVGSFMRSIAKSEQKSEADKRILNDTLLARYTNEYNASTTEGFAVDISARLKQYRETYCDPLDNNNGLDFMCEHDQDNNLDGSDRGDAAPGGIGAETAERLRMNKDIDFLRMIEFPQTLDIDFSDEDASDDEEDTIALAANLYWPQPLEWTPGKDSPKQYPAFLDARRVIAMNALAHNSYANLVGMKAKSEPLPSGSTVEPGWTFMKTFMRDFGITDDEIEDLVGEEPSYWAQMDILTKKMYQSPHFYTNLYDKPANVNRISVALDAIKLMQMRDHFDSSLRREMLNAAMIELELGPQYDDVNSRLIAQ